MWTILLVILICFFVKTDYHYFFTFTPKEQTAFAHKISEGVFDGYGIFNVVLHEIASYIRAHTEPFETVYVWGISPQLFF